MSRHEDEMAEIGRRKADDIRELVRFKFDAQLQESHVIKQLLARIEVLEGKP